MGEDGAGVVADLDVLAAEIASGRRLGAHLDLELFALLAGEKAHLPGDAKFSGALAEGQRLFSWPAQLRDADTTEPLEEVAPADPTQLSSFQRQVVQALCAPWLAGASLESLPSNEQIAALLGTPGATGTVKAALRRIYAKAGLSDQPAHAKRRALCRVARQRGWV